jgi:PAS domain S-box-containing protein
MGIYVAQDELRVEQEARRKAEDALRERVKELRCLRELSLILQETGSIEEILQRVVTILPPAWQYEHDTVARIIYLDEIHQTSDFSLCLDAQSSPLRVNRTTVGSVEVGYLSEHPVSDEGSFLKEERRLLDIVAESLARAIGRLLDEQALKAEERKYRLLAENTLDVIWSTDLEMTFTYVNPAVNILTGHDPEELVGATLSEFVDENNLALLADTASKAVENGPESEGLRVEANLLRKDGSLVPVEIRGKALFDQRGTPIGLQGTTRDVTERRRAQEDLRRSEERHRHLFETMAQGSIFLDSEGKCTSVNTSAVRILGRSREELLDSCPFTPSWELKQPDGTEWPHEKWPIAVALQTAQRVEPVLVGVFNPQDKDYRWLRVSAIPLPLVDDTSPPELNVIFEDLTALRQAEEQRLQVEVQLRRAEKLEAVGRLAGGIAHDFNNMLSIILGNTEIALSQAEHSDLIHSELLEIQTAAQKSVELTQQLLSFARLRDTDPEHLNMNNCIEDSMVMLKSLLGEDIELKWEPWSAAVPVKTDPAQLDRILVVLTQNARDAIENVGSITIKTEIKQLDETCLPQNTESTPGPYAVLTVSDTGIGMDQHTLSRVFEPYFSTKPRNEREGLGLATVHGLVKQNGGFTNIYSEPGVGTVVRVYLPQAQEEISHPSPRGSVNVEPLKPGDETILLVDDENSLLTMVARLLKRLGYRVLPADSPAKALELFREHSEEIDLLLTDIVMPQMNGQELFHQMTALKPDLKCLFMSGYTFDILAHRGVDQPEVNLLQKPFSIRELGHQLRDVLDL